MRDNVEESDKRVTSKGLIPVGSAVFTTSGKLPCKAVIHTVRPRMIMEIYGKEFI
jgi:O-acetyl-ADP-ribose deacetylase (regulator of RNase III)